MFLRSEEIYNLNQRILIDHSKISNNLAQVAGSIDSKDIHLNISTTSSIQDNIGLLFGSKPIASPSRMMITNSNEIPNLKIDTAFDIVLNDV